MGTGAKPLERKPNGLSVVLGPHVERPGRDPYSGAMEMLHLKGLASRWRWQHWRLELVGSRRYLNGSFAGASVPRVDISGYNRTPMNECDDPPYDWI